MGTALNHSGARRATGSSGTETVGLTLLAAVPLLGGVHLTAAHLASRIAGDPPLRAGLAEATVALARLASTPGDPRRAWAPESANALPGPVPYWVSLGIVLAAVVTLTIAALRLWRRLGGQCPSVLGVKANAGLGNARDLRALWVRRTVAGRLTLGRVGDRLVATEPQVSLAVIGPTGCGKTAGFAIPALLEWQGPVICTSVKTDLIKATLAHRSRLGRTWLFDPSAAVPGLGSTWSPLSACSTWGGAIRMAEWLCEAAQPRRDTVTDKDYWYTQAGKALAPHLHAAALSGRTMRDVLRWVDRQEQEAVREALCRDAGVLAAVEEALSGLGGEELRRQMEPRIRSEVLDAVRAVLRADSGRRAELAEQRVSAWPVELQEHFEERVTAELEARVRQAIEARVTAEFRESGSLDALVSVEALWRQEERLRGSVYATVQNVLACYADPVVAAATAGSDIDFDAWLAGPNTVFVVAPSFEQTRLRPVLTVLIQQAIRRAYETANAAGGTLEHPCLVLLDEAGNITPLADLPVYAATARSHGISLVTVWQDLAQIQSIYGDRAATVLNNHRAKIFGRELGDLDTLEYVSRLAGDLEQIERNYSADLSGGRRSVSEHTAFRPALPIDALRRMPPGEALLVYGGELPVRLRLRPWFREPGLTEIGGPDPDGPFGNCAKLRQLPQNAEAA